MSSLFKRFFFLLILMSALTETESAFSEVFQAGVIPFSPFYDVEDGEVKGGIYTEMLELTLERAGLEYTLSAYSPGDLFSGIENGDIHIWMGTPANGAIASPRPITAANIMVYTSYSVSPPASVSDLKGKRVLVIDGYNYGGLMKNLSAPSMRITLDRIRSHETVFSRLSSGLERYAVDYQEPAEKAMRDLNIKNVKSHILKTVEVRFYVSKKAPGAEKLMERLMKAYEALKVEGHF